MCKLLIKHILISNHLLNTYYSSNWARNLTGQQARLVTYLFVSCLLRQTAS